MSSNFRRLQEPGTHWINIEIEGEVVQVAEGETVAAAVLASGLCSCRTTVLSGDARAPFCMMGVCYECLMEIDGVPNRQTCQIEVKEGMKIRRQNGTGEGYDTAGGDETAKRLNTVEGFITSEGFNTSKGHEK